MRVLKTTKMYSKILVVVLLAFFLDNLSAAILNSAPPTSLNGKDTLDKFKNPTVINPRKSKTVNLQRTISGNVNVNPVLPNNVRTQPASPVSEQIQTIKNDNGTNKSKSPTIPTVRPSIKNGNGLPLLNLPKSGNPVSEEFYKEDSLKNNQVETSPLNKNPLKTTFSNGINNLKAESPASKAPIPTTVPTNGNDNHQVLNKLKEGDDDYDYKEEIEDRDHEQLLEKSKTIPSPNQSKLMLSSSSSKSTLPESVKQGNDNQEFKILKERDDYTEEDDYDEGDDYTEEGDDYDEGDDYTEEGDDYDDKEIEDRNHGEPLENSKPVASPNQNKTTLPMKINNSSNKLQTNQPLLSSPTSKSTVQSVRQENDNQEFYTLGEDGDEEVEKNEDGQYGEEYLEDPIHSTPLIPKGSINEFQADNTSEPINNPSSMVPQVSEDDFTDSNYNGSEYYFNTNKDHQADQNVHEWLESESSNFKPTDSYETIDRNNDNTKVQSINTNEFESNLSDNTQILSDKQEGNIDDQFNNQSTLENKEKMNGYNAMKRILYMLHDYASLAFNWIINKINYQMELASS